MLSFWEKDEFLKYDAIIIGGGIVGLSTAISLKEQTPKLKVLVLEQGTFPTGASTKNAGFACFGSLTEILADLKTMSREEVFELVKLRWEGLRLLRKRLGDEVMDYHNFGGYEILTESQLPVLARIAEVNELLYPLFGKDIYEERSGDLANFGFNPERARGLIFNPFEAQIHTGKMMQGLASLARQLDIEVLTGTSVASFEDSGNVTEIVTDKGIKFQCEKLAICTNAFTKELIPSADLIPGRGVVLITKPIKNLRLKGTFHYDEGYYYFRNYQDRVLFGGGRNMDVEGENTVEFDVRDLILNKLKADLAQLILPGQTFEIDHTWAGIMAFGENKQPILKSHSKNVFLGLRLGGMGVAIGSKMGQDLATLMFC